MKVVLADALHARPANLFVRVASTYQARVEVRFAGRVGDAKNILQVLTLGAAKGDTVEVFAFGDDADAVLAALVELVNRNFDADLVPETGAAVVSGLAVGPAVVMSIEEDAPELSLACGSAAAARLVAAFAEVRRDLQAIVRALPEADAQLFEPEIAIIDALQEPVVEKVAAGALVEDALRNELARGQTEGPVSDLLVDARDRLLAAFVGGARLDLASCLAQAPEGDVVLVVRELTPSIVAAAPRRVAGIVAISGDAETIAVGRGYASHAAILARGRGIPLLFVGEHAFDAIVPGEVVVLDTRPLPPRFWPSPSEARVAAARTDRDDLLRREREEDAEGAAPLLHLVTYGEKPFAIRVNLGSVHDRVPVASDGVGLVRTELLYAARPRAPSAEEQFATLLLLAGKVHRGPLVVRLFDAGGDKPITWLPPTKDALDARGIELLLGHPDLLRHQVDAIVRVATRHEVRLLIPLTRSAADVDAVRALVPNNVAVGAMIETPAAVSQATSIARAADFVCVGTNDLHAFVRGEDRTKIAATAIDPRVLEMVRRIVASSHAEGREVTVCGEMAADPNGALVLAGLGVDAISVAPARFAAVHAALARVSHEDCQKATERAMSNERGTP